MILAISPARKGFGYALVKNREEAIEISRIYLKMATIQGVMKHFRKLIEIYQPEKLVLLRYEKPIMENTRDRVILESMETYAQAHQIQVHHVTENERKTAFGQYEVKTNYELTIFLADAFPQFRHRVPLPKKANRAEQYAMPMFKALALAMTYLYREE